MICLDTSLLIDLLKNKKEAVEKINALKGESLTTTRINVFEILFGFFYRGGKEKFRKDIRLLIDKLEVLELDEIAAIKAAEIATYLVKDGHEIEHSDALIAGIMLANGYNKIITNDTHFRRIKELKIESY